MIWPIALVLRRVEASEEMVRFVEVAVPEIVSPPAWVPLPIVEEPSPRKPLENVRTVEVELLTNG